MVQFFGVFTINCSEKILKQVVDFGQNERNIRRLLRD